MRNMVALAGRLRRVGALRSSASPAYLFSANEVGVWYDPSDLTTLFQDSAGTTPVTAAGQPVGLMLDKSKGLALGSEILPNGDFSQGSTGWSVNTGWTISGGVATHTGAAGHLISTPASAFTTGLSYVVEFDYSGNTGICGVYVKGTFHSPAISAASGHFKAVIVAGSDARGVSLFATAGFVVDNFSAKLLAGNHATQATSAQRPTYGFHPYSGLRNRANGSADVGNATYWNAGITTNGITATRIAFGFDTDGFPYADYTVAGTATLDSIINTYDRIQSRLSALTGQTYTLSCTVRRISGSAPPAGCGLNLAIVEETAPSTVLAVNSSTFTDVSSTDQIASYSATLANVLTNQVGATARIFTPVGSTVNYTVRVKALQFERGSTRTAYQDNFSQYNVTEAGVPSVYYLAFDGVDDGMVTSAIDFSATGAVTVFAGVRKLSDAALGVVAELGIYGASGTFSVGAPGGASATYRFGSCGTTAIAALTGTTFQSPNTAVLTGIGKISSDIVSISVNGATPVLSTGDQGTGNYSNAILYIGRRGGSSLPFSGNLYSLIVRGAQSTTGQITSTESWVNGKTGAY